LFSNREKGKKKEGVSQDKIANGNCTGIADLIPLSITKKNSKNEMLGAN